LQNKYVRIIFYGLALTILITLTGGIYTLSIVKSDFDIMVQKLLESSKMQPNYR
jgi:hypothetical protein